VRMRAAQAAGRADTVRPVMTFVSAHAADAVLPLVMRGPALAAAATFAMFPVVLLLAHASAALAFASAPLMFEQAKPVHNGKPASFRASPDYRGIHQQRLRTLVKRE